MAKEINNHFTSTILDNKFSGPCIVIGSGPSSKQLAECPSWKNIYSISCNYSQINFPSQLYFYQDKDFIFKNKEFLSKKKYLGVSILPTSQKALENKELMSDLGGFFINRVKYSKEPQWIKTKNSEKLQCSTPITGSIAISMAYIMGFNPIIAVGFDAQKGSYSYLKHHPVFGKNNGRAALMHADGQSEFLKKWGRSLNLINCSDGNWSNEKKKLCNILPDMKFHNKKDSQRKVEELFHENLKANNSIFLKNWIRKDGYF